MARLWPMAAAAGLLALSLGLFWPGVVLYDAVDQYRQALSGAYDDWHPPIMARLWTALLAFGPGAGAMLAVQMGSYWLGLGLLAQGLGGRRALAVLVIGACPIFVGWQGAVLKDGQMVGALVLAVGLVACWRLRGRRLPWPAVLGAALLMAYATLVRANAAFSTIPLAALLLPASMPRAAKAALAVVGIPAAILLSQAVNYGVLHARDSGVRNVQALYDLAAIAVRTGDGGGVGLRAADVAALRANHCVKPLFWDPLGEVPACDAAVQPLARRKVGELYVDLAKAMVRHPVAYLESRLAHLNSTERWLVARHWPGGGPPAKTEPNTLGLANPGSSLAAGWQALAGLLAETPLGWPVAWVVLGLWGLGVAIARPPGASRDLAVALLGSALCQEASFAAISISSDLRYHLWAMLAVALAWALLGVGRVAGGKPVATFPQPALAPRPASKGLWRTALAVLGLVILTGLASRAVLPPPPPTYAALLK